MRAVHRVAADRAVWRRDRAEINRQVAQAVAHDHQRATKLFKAES